MEICLVLCALCFCPLSDSENRDRPPVWITSPWLCRLAFQGGTGQLTACLAVSQFHHSAGSWALYGVERNVQMSLLNQRLRSLSLG